MHGRLPGPSRLVQGHPAVEPTTPPPLQARLDGNPPCRRRLLERLVVALVLVGIGLGELGDGPVEGGAGAQVAGDGDPVAGAGVGPGQGQGADCRRTWSAPAGSTLRRRTSPSSPGAGGRRSPGSPRRVLRTAGQPRKMSLAACIRCWPATTRCAVVGVAALAHELLQHRRFGLLGLQEQRVVVVPADHQQDPGPGARRCPPPPPCGRPATNWNSSSRWRRSDCEAAPVAAHELVERVEE